MRKKNHHDRRVRRTQKLIRKAFLKLIAEKNYNQITVTDIINEADYNRTTFYRHYYDKDHLVDEIINSQIELFIEAFIKPYQFNDIIDLGQLKAEQIVIFNHILEHKDFYSLWGKLKTIPGFTQKYTDSIKKIYEQKILITESLRKDVNQEIYMQFYGYGMAGIIFNWIDGGFKQTPKYMAEQIIIIFKSTPSKSMLYPGVKIS